MFGKIIGAYIGNKIMARSGRGASGALVGAGSAAVARRGVKPLAVLLAAGYGLKILRDYRRNQRSDTA